MCIILLIEFYRHYAVLEKIKGNITFRHSNCKNSKYSNCTERLIVARLERVTRVGRVGKIMKATYANATDSKMF